jgi:PhnB protein
MATINPYLNFNGNTEEAFNFYRSVFGGEFTTLQRFKDTPEADRVPASDKEKIMHVSLPIGKGNVLMATDALESMGHALTVGNNFSIAVNAESEEEADKLFSELSAGGQVTMPLQKAFRGAYFGMLADKFGIQWMVNYDYNQRNSSTRRLRPFLSKSLIKLVWPP